MKQETKDLLTYFLSDGLRDASDFGTIEAGTELSEIFSFHSVNGKAQTELTIDNFSLYVIADGNYSIPYSTPDHILETYSGEMGLNREFIYVYSLE